MFRRFDQLGAEHIVMQAASRGRRRKIVGINPSSVEVAATRQSPSARPLNIHGRQRGRAPEVAPAGSGGVQVSG